MTASGTADEAHMSRQLLRTVVGSLALIGATALGLATGSLLPAVVGLGAASVVVFRGPFLVRDQRGNLSPFDPGNPWQSSDVLQGFSLFVESMLALAALSALAWLLTSHH